MFLQKVLIFIYCTLTSKGLRKTDLITIDTYFYLILERILLLESEIKKADKNKYEGNSLFKKQLDHSGNSKFFLNAKVILNETEIKKILPFIKIEIRKNMSKSLKPSSLSYEKFDSIISVNQANLTGYSRKKLIEKIHSLKKEIEENYKENILFWHRVKEVKEKILFEESENTDFDNSETEVEHDSDKIHLEDSQKVVSNDSFKKIESYDNDLESFNKENDSIISDSSYLKKLSPEEDDPLVNKENKILNLKMIEYIPENFVPSLQKYQAKEIEVENLEKRNDGSLNEEEMKEKGFDKNDFNNFSLISTTKLNKTFKDSLKKPLISQNNHSSEGNKIKKKSEKENDSSSNSSKDKPYSSEKGETLDFEKSEYENENPEEKIKQIFKENNLENFSSISNNESNESFSASLKNLFNPVNYNSIEVNKKRNDCVKENCLSSGSSWQKSYERSICLEILEGISSSDSFDKKFSIRKSSEESISWVQPEDSSSEDSSSSSSSEDSSSSNSSENSSSSDSSEDSSSSSSLENNSSSSSSDNSSSSDSSEDSSSSSFSKDSSSSGSSKQTELLNFDPVILYDIDRKETPRLKTSITTKNLFSSQDEEKLFRMKKLPNSSKSIYENYSDFNSDSIKVVSPKNNSLNLDKIKDRKELDLYNNKNNSIGTKNRSNENIIPSKKSENSELSEDKEIRNNVSRTLVRVRKGKIKS